MQEWGEKEGNMGYFEMGNILNFVSVVNGLGGYLPAWRNYFISIYEDVTNSLVVSS